MLLCGAARLVSMVCQAAWRLPKLHPPSRVLSRVTLSHSHFFIAPSCAAAPSAGLLRTDCADQHVPPALASCFWSVVPRTRSQPCCKAPSPVGPHPWYLSQTHPCLTTYSNKLRPQFHINQDLFIRVREAGNSVYVFFCCDEMSVDLINSLCTKRNLHSYFLDIYRCPFLIRGQASFARDVTAKFNPLVEEQLNAPHEAVASELPAADASDVCEGVGGAGIREHGCGHHGLSRIHSIEAVWTRIFRYDCKTKQVLLYTNK